MLTPRKKYKEGFDTLLFARLDETTAGVRAALKQMGLDAEASLPIRKEVALLITALISSKAKTRCQCKRPSTLGSDHRICRNACRS